MEEDDEKVKDDKENGTYLMGDGDLHHRSKR